ncbi:MAG: tyrosine-type recombinase/integrase [Streptosporangiaceae bacterium]
MKSYEVKFWTVRPGKAKARRTWEVRWKVGAVPHSRTIGNKAQADSFLSDLRQAARKGEAFDTGTGLPDSMGRPASRERSWLAFCLAYTDMKWPAAAPKTRDALTDALATIIPAVTSEPAPEGITLGVLREALRHFALAPASRAMDRPPPVAAALRWLEKASLPVSLVAKPQHARAVLDAISVRLDGTAASATTIARKRSVFANVIRYAVELEEMPSSPLERLSWKPPKVAEVVDRRVVVNPRQARELLTAVTYVGEQRRGPHARGQRLMALYACMYYAALRPAEAVGLRRQDCLLPGTGWGRLTLEKSRPEVNRRWTDTGAAHGERGLKHRAANETRRVPIPPELVAILRAHIDTFGVAPDGRIFSSERGHPVASTAISDVWAQARTLALTPAQVVSPLAGRPYDLRHAAVSLWLAAGVPPPRVAERAGHSVEVLLRVYAKCVDNDDETANTRIDAALCTS